MFAGLFFVLTIIVVCGGVAIWAADRERSEQDAIRNRYLDVAHRIGNIGKFVGTGLHGRRPILGLLPPKGKDGHLRNL